MAPTCPNPLPRRIERPLTGDHIEFLSSPLLGEGDALIFRCTMAPLLDGPPLHTHDATVETFEVEHGALEIDLGSGSLLLLGPGEGIEILPGTPHGFCNPLGQEVQFICTATPGHALERFLRTIYGLAAEGRVNIDGMPANPVATAGALHGTRMRFAGLSSSVQPGLTRLLAGVARLTGMERDLLRFWSPAGHGPTMMRAPSAAGAAAITFAILFNIPYAVLASRYDYPAILRRPASEILDRFAAGGPMLILAWHGFALCALLLVPLAVVLAITPARLARTPGLAIGAAVAGALAGLTQAIGLSRWVFVVPSLARSHADRATSPGVRIAAEQALDVLNAYGGVAIGEHLGQLLTALFIAQLAMLQLGEKRRIAGGLGLAAAVAITIGTGEGVAWALGGTGAPFAMATVAGFMGLTLWFIVTGAGLSTYPDYEAGAAGSLAVSSTR